MKILENTSLLKYNTFGINATCEKLIIIDSEDDIKELVSSNELSTSPYFILGGGSNVVFMPHYKGNIIKINIQGIEAFENNNSVSVKVGAGVVWVDFIKFCIKNEYWGAENLTLIPGCVGASPVQNVGAYGVEAKDIIDSVRAVEIATGNIRIFTNEECKFGYRDSIFKKELAKKYIISEVTFKLNKKGIPNISYGAIKECLNGNLTPNIKEIADAIDKIRVEKLPDPKDIGSAGSFFKNPVIGEQQFEELKRTFPNIVSYPQGENKYKIAAGWLIEQCGWKGHSRDTVGVFPKQALVLYNINGCTGTDVLTLAKDIKESIKNRFNIELECEAVFV